MAFNPWMHPRYAYNPTAPSDAYAIASSVGMMSFLHSGLLGAVCRMSRVARVQVSTFVSTGLVALLAGDNGLLVYGIYGKYGLLYGRLS